MGESLQKEEWAPRKKKRANSAGRDHLRNKRMGESARKKNGRSRSTSLLSLIGGTKLYNVLFIVGSSLRYKNHYCVSYPPQMGSNLNCCIHMLLGPNIHLNLRFNTLSDHTMSCCTLYWTGVPRHKLKTSEKWGKGKVYVGPIQ